jgi:hypothetical protein
MLSSCGQKDNQPVYFFPNSAVLWSGSASEDETLSKTLAEVNSCMESFGYSRDGFPSVIVVEQPFDLGNGEVSGCIYWNHLIYIAKSTSATYPSYVSGIPIYTPTLRHEFIHWITKKGDADHGTDYMQECTR